MNPRRMLLFGLLLVFALVIAGCAQQGEPGPAGPAGPPGPEGPAGPPGEVSATDLSCTECHTAGTLLTGKATAWSESMHGTGEAYVRATSADCAGCHSGGGFAAMAAAGLNPGTVEEGDPNPTRQDCRACHQIHSSYTDEDWALTTTDPVALYAFEGVTFDGGEGNLCANCHQPRRQISEADADGNVEVDSTHWGPHHGPQAAMLLGVGGAGDVAGSPSSHGTLVENTCVSCHLGEGASHTFEPDIAACQGCHAGIEEFDVNGSQTAVDAKLEELKTALVAKGLWDGEADHPVVGVYPAAEAQALWNYIFIAVEDSSHGLHNAAYTNDLLDASLEALK